MITYYLTQHLLMALALAGCAFTAPKTFHLPLMPRILLSASLTPQILGAVVMALAYLDVHSRWVYINTPFFISIFLLCFTTFRIKYSGIRIRYPLISFSLADFVFLCLVVLVAAQLIWILYGNINRLTVLAHDFNVYAYSAKLFSLSPGFNSLPSFNSINLGLIPTHPHSFIYEAYFSHALMFETPTASIVSLDLFARLAAQLTLIYMLLAIVAASIAMGGKRSAFMSICLTIFLPFTYYIAGALSRDAFLIVPVIGLIVVMATLAINSCANLFHRGLLAGLYILLAVMSHTLGLLYSMTIALCILCYAMLLRLRNLKSILIYMMPVFIMTALASHRYFENYLNTGHAMGYGLAYIIYKGTWLESILGTPWLENHSTLETFKLLLSNYCFPMQLAAIVTAILSAGFTKSRGRSTYTVFFIVYASSLLIYSTGMFVNSGLSIKNAMIVNFRYPLSYFLLSAPLLAVGFERIVRELRFKPFWCSLITYLAMACMVFLATYSLQTKAWRTLETNKKDLQQILIVNRSLDCLDKNQEWFVNEDRWNTYFLKHPPIYAFSQAGLPFISSQTIEEIGQVINSKNIGLFYFENPQIWYRGKLYEYLKLNWTVLKIPGGSYSREIWSRGETTKCLQKHSVSPLSNNEYELVLN